MQTSPRAFLPKALLGAIYLAAVYYYTRLLLANSLRIHAPREFGDSSEYLREAGLPVFSAAFWTQMKPAVTALIYKLVGPSEPRIFTFQLWLTIVCWTVLALAVAHAVRTFYLKPIAFALVLAFSLSRDVFMWIPFIGSEAIAFSSLALFIACALWLLVEWKPWKIPLLLLTAFLTVFSRDTFTVVLLLIALALVPFLWFRSHRAQLLVIIAGFVVISAAGFYTAKVAHRFERYVFPIIVDLRIFPNPEYVGYFRQQGMPVDPALVQLSDSSRPGWDKWAVSRALLDNPDQQPWREWVSRHGALVYAKFLWKYKQDTLQNMFVARNGSDTFFPDVYYYTATGYHPIIKDEQLSEFLYPTRFGLLFFFAANLIAAFAASFAIMHRWKLWLVPLLMILLTYPQAFLVWNGDANDVPRHSVAHNITERLGFWILVLFVLDLLLQAAEPVLVRVAQSAWSRVHRIAANRQPVPAKSPEQPSGE